MEEMLANNENATETPVPVKPCDEGTGDDRPGAGGEDAPDVDELRRIRLIGFLRELVRAEGRMEAAELLGVNYRTMVRAEEQGEMTGRMRDALERLLWRAEGAGTVRLRERVDALEERLEAMSSELRGALKEISTTGSGGTEGEGGDNVREKEDGGNHKEVSRTPDAHAVPPVAGLHRRKPVPYRWADPEVVTVDPTEDDSEVYGPAWPLVEEWRRLRAGHPNRGRSMSWLLREERLLVLELAMLEDHGLTLPPETQPLRGFGRRGQTVWRRTALHDTRSALHRRRMLRWVRRLVTLGLWRK